MSLPLRLEPVLDAFIVHEKTKSKRGVDVFFETRIYSKTLLSAAIVGVPTIPATCLIVDIYGKGNRRAVSDSSGPIISVGGDGAYIESSAAGPGACDGGRGRRLPKQLIGQEYGHCFELSMAAHDQG